MMYLQALGLQSDMPDVHYGLATVYFQLRELTIAAHHFKEVTRLDPSRVGAFVNLGAVYNLLDQLDDAVTALRRSIQLDGKRVEGYYNLGRSTAARAKPTWPFSPTARRCGSTRAWPTPTSISVICYSRRSNSAWPRPNTSTPWSCGPAGRRRWTAWRPPRRPSPWRRTRAVPV